MTDPMELVGRLDKLRDEPSRFVWEVNSVLTEAAACIREMVDRREGMEEDLYQAVLVAYRRGAVTWVEMNYPKWFANIEAGRECLPPRTKRQPMNEIALAIHDVSMRRLERASRPGKWRVYLDGENVVFENLERNEPPVVVTTVVKEVE